MRRKMIPVFLSFSLGIFINALVEQKAYEEIGLILISSVLIWRFFLLNHFKNYFFVVCCIFLVAGFLCQSYSCSKKSSLESYYGKTVTLKGTVVSAKKTKQGNDLLYLEIDKQNKHGNSQVHIVV